MLLAAELQSCYYPYTLYKSGVFPIYSEDIFSNKREVSYPHERIYVCNLRAIN